MDVPGASLTMQTQNAQIITLEMVLQARQNAQMLVERIAQILVSSHL